MKAQSTSVMDVTVDADHMAAWCKHHGYPIGDAAGRVKERLN
jgi:hypothetical protein